MILNLSIIQKKFLDCLLVNSVVNESEIVKISKIELDTIFADYGNIDSIIYNINLLQFSVQEGNHIKYIHIFESIIFDINIQNYVFVFSKDIYKYLVNDIQFFLFNFKYSKPLYLILHENLSKDNEFNFDIKYIRNRLNLDSKYIKNNDLIRSVILPAVEEINKYSAINVTSSILEEKVFKPGKKKISNIVFTVSFKELHLFGNIQDTMDIQYNIPGQISLDDYKKDLEQQFLLERERKNNEFLNDKTKNLNPVEKSKFIGDLLRDLSSRNIDI